MTKAVRSHYYSIINNLKYIYIPSQGKYLWRKMSSLYCITTFGKSGEGKIYPTKRYYERHNYFLNV